VPEDVQSVTNGGRLFHSRGPATAKARSPIVVRRVVGTTRADEDVDRRAETTVRGYSDRPERQSARMSKLTNDGLTRSGTGCFIAVAIWATVGVSGIIYSIEECLFTLSYIVCLERHARQSDAVRLDL